MFLNHFVHILFYLYWNYNTSLNFLGQYLNVYISFLNKWNVLKCPHLYYIQNPA